MLSHKWDNILYNDINPLATELFKKALNGDYSYDRFTPEWVSKEQFRELKNKDGYIKYIWSFGNDGSSYMFGPDKEPIKRAAHRAVVFRDYEPLKAFGINAEWLDEYTTISDRHKAFCRHYRQENKEFAKWRGFEQLERLEQLQQLQQLQQLERLERLQQLEITNMSYKDYEYKDGDIVYCDIPYEQVHLKKNTNNDYNDAVFGNKEFYEWAKTRPFQIFFSSYDISDTVFIPILEIPVRTTMSASSNTVKKDEKLYTQKNLKKV